MTSRRRAAAALVLAGLLIGFLLDVPSIVKRRLEARLVREAASRGLALTVGRIGFGLPLHVTLHDVVAEGHGGAAVAARLVLRLRPALSARRAVTGFAFERAVVSMPGDLVLDLPAGSWDVERLDSREARLVTHGGTGRLLARREGGALSLALLSVDLGRDLRIRFGGSEPARLGVASGAVSAIPAADGSWSWDVVGECRGARVAALSDETNGPNGRRFGAPLDLALSASGVLFVPERRVELACLRLAAAGAVVEAEGDFAVGEHDVAAEGRLLMPRASLSDLLATSGTGISPAAGGDLGSVALAVSGSGHLKDPSSIRIEQQLSFTPPVQPPPAMLALKRPFTRTLDGAQGPHVVDLTPGARDFVPLDEVPPLFVRTLLISEDAGFWGHPGIDLQEIPVAFATNWARGTRARGASTITQQLAKNLFLSRRKSYGRKLQELAFTLLLESTLGKRRILEIYLNVIEWGPNVYGLRAAARHYFGREPRDLTPCEGAFLVALIPAPVKYQASFRAGALTPRFAVLVDNLLAKLRSVDAITDEEYEAALAEELRFGGRPREGDEGSPPEETRTEDPEPTDPPPEAPAPGT